MAKKVTITLLPRGSKWVVTDGTNEAVNDIKEDGEKAWKKGIRDHVRAGHVVLAHVRKRDGTLETSATFRPDGSVSVHKEPKADKEIRAAAAADAKAAGGVPRGTSKRAAKYRALTAAEEAALADYATKHGQGWKTTLAGDWLHARTNATLHRLRNDLGPAWLKQYTLPAAKAPKAAPKAAGKAPKAAGKAKDITAKVAKATKAGLDAIDGKGKRGKGSGSYYASAAHLGGPATTERRAFQPLAAWSTSAGGTSAAPGKYGYSLVVDAKDGTVAYYVQPYTTKGGQHAGYLLSRANQSGTPGLASGLYAGITPDGTETHPNVAATSYRSPQAAHAAARKHYDRFLGTARGGGVPRGTRPASARGWEHTHDGYRDGRKVPLFKVGARYYTRSEHTALDNGRTVTNAHEDGLYSEIVPRGTAPKGKGGKASAKAASAAPKGTAKGGKASAKAGKGAGKAREPNAYMTFAQPYIAGLRAEDPDLSMKEAMKLAGAEWRRRQGRA